MEILVHPLTHDPTAAWRELSKSQRVIKVSMSNPQTTIPFNKARVVCMSDTHSLTPYMKFSIPYGDIFIHAGDFTKCGQLDEVIEFDTWLGSLPHKYKFVIAGNHELSFDPTFANTIDTSSISQRTGHTVRSVANSIPTLGNSRKSIEDAIQTQDIKQHLTNCHYIEDDLVSIYGLNIYGSPWQPEFCKWAFNIPRGYECLERWKKIPEDVDILVTHTPPVGHGDLCCSGVRAGCVELLTTVQQRVKPKYHIFGHIHEGYGITSDGRTIFVNASTCDINYLPNNPPIVFDISLPRGFSKNM